MCRILCVALSLSASAALAAAGATETDLFGAHYKDKVFPMFVRYCTECHNLTKKKGGLRLDELVDANKITADPEKWQTLLEQITSNEMPPEDKPRPKPEDIDTMAEWARNAIAYVDGRRPKDPGYVLPQRLNRTEYNNTVRDLTGLDIKPADTFPIDDSGYGFDNIADVLTMSPLLAEKYLDAAEAIIEAGFTPKSSSGTSSSSSPEDKSEVGLIPDGRFTIRKQGVTNVGGVLSFTEEGVTVCTLECAAGKEYEIKAQAWQQRGGSEDAKAAVFIDGKLIASIDVDAVKLKPKTISARFKATAAKHELTLAFTNDFFDAKTKEDRNLYITKVRLVPVAAAAAPTVAKAPEAAPLPPVNAEFAKRVLIVTPAKPGDERNAAEAILKNFTTRAFRRPVRADEVLKLLSLYDAGKKGGNHYTGLHRALTAV
ncbi:MAG TPA: DUF1587 domain-containing protein, partial [Planctomycetota bacterium]|nr:DUF1587 domain-containing protein [Planctomycetota bacterium]